MEGEDSVSEHARLQRRGAPAGKETSSGTDRTDVDVCADDDRQKVSNPLEPAAEDGAIRNVSPKRDKSGGDERRQENSVDGQVEDTRMNQQDVVDRAGPNDDEETAASGQNNTQGLDEGKAGPDEDLPLGQMQSGYVGGSSESDEGELLRIEKGETLDRDAIFMKGVELEERGNIELALKCYAASVAGLAKGETFSKLPDYLRKMSEYYFREEEFDTALQFIQAEKLYYETAILASNQQQTMGEPKCEESGLRPEEARGERKDQRTALADRASEFEFLSQMCLNEHKPQLALDYCGKAAKLRQTVFGDQHPVTTQSLDMFTAIYAEVGREQYSAAMGRALSKEGDEASCKHADTTPKSDSLPKEKRPGRHLQLRRNSQGDHPSVSLTPPTPHSQQQRLLIDKTHQEKVDNTDEGSDCIKPPKSGSEMENVLRRRRVGQVQNREAGHPKDQPDGKIHNEDETKEASPSRALLVLFLLISAVVAIFITVLWCRWLVSSSCFALGNLLSNFSDHFQLFWIKFARQS